MISTRHLGALALGVLLLAGCGAIDIDAARMERMPAAPPTADTTPEGVEASEPEPTESDVPVPPSDLAELRHVTAEGVGLRLGVPKDWLSYDEDRYADAAGPEGLQAAADAMGVDVEDLKAMIPSLELLLIDGVGNNINVVDASVLGELPTAAAIRAQFEAVNADVTKIRDVDTPAGAARVGYYQIEIAGELRYGAGAFVQLSTGVVVVTFTAFDEATRERLVDKVLPTLEQVGSPGEA